MLLKLLGLPITLPAAGIKFCLEQIAELAESELTDDTAVREQLLLLQVQLEDGEIDEQEYAAREAELLRRLREIRAYREQRARAALAQEPGTSELEGRRAVAIETPFDDVQPA